MIGSRIASAKMQIDNAQQAANQEEKSSAGDKYETSRAMSHLEKNMYSRQLAENMKELSALQIINADTICSEATTGAVIQCTNASFFIAAGLGKQIIDDKEFFFLSPHAPLAKLLLHKKIGDHVIFHETNNTITDLF